MAIVPDRWALLRYRFAGPYARVRLEDQRQRTASVYWNWSRSEIDAEALRPVAAHLEELVRDLPKQREGPHSSGPVPLAVFLDIPRFLWSEPSFHAALTGALLSPSLPADRIQFVLFGGQSRVPRVPFSLPFDIVSIGEVTAGVLDRFQSNAWALQQPVAQRGLKTTAVEATDLPSLEGVLRQHKRDILVTSDLAGALDVCRALPLIWRPRLVVAMDAGASLGVPPAGIALVRLRPSMPASAVAELLFGLIHDYPIHEAVKGCVPKSRGEDAVEIVATPATNQSLRMRDALLHLTDAAEKLSVTLPTTGLDAFIKLASRPRRAGRSWRRLRNFDLGSLRIEPGPDDLDFVKTKTAYDDLVWLRRQTVDLRQFPVTFEQFARESTGLIPMSKQLEIIENAQARAAAQLPTMRRITADPALAEIMELEQSRVIDVALQRFETAPLFTYVERSSTVAAGATYRVRVHIGDRLSESLIIEPIAPIDWLLPPTDDGSGHLLDVVVQGKDFAVIGGGGQELRLPKFGGSAPIYFSVRAPDDLGTAALRVHIYYRNHLVQSFLLETQVTAAEKQADADRGTRVSMVFTRVRRLVLDQVQPRAFSIGVNANAIGTHELALKGDGTSGVVALLPSAYTAEVQKYRALLDYAARDPVNRDLGRTYGRVAAGDQAPDDVADIIRNLADQGSNLYVSLLTKVNRIPGSLLRQRLVALQGAHDQKIQIVRFDETFVFPWTLLYDYALPAGGVQGAPVCLGWTRDAAGTVTPCGHGPKTNAICINGFWGIRHCVEEVIGHGEDLPAPISRPAMDAVRVVCGDASLPGATGLPTGLKVFVPRGQLAEGPAVEQSLVDLLWQAPPARPAILILLGHMELAGAGGGDFPRLVLTPQHEWLTKRGLSTRAASSATPWDQPRTMVMLMACDSAATSSDTVNDFVSILNLAGAAAVIGTEAVVPSDVAATGAETLTRLLWTDKKTLGEAMTNWRRQLLSEGNPLAFVFHAIGNVDLAIQ